MKPERLIITAKMYYNEHFTKENCTNLINQPVFKDNIPIGVVTEVIPHCDYAFVYEAIYPKFVDMMMEYMDKKPVSIELSINE